MAKATTRITVQQAIDYLGALKQLESYPKLIKTPQGNQVGEQLEQVRFSFAGDALLAIAIMLNRLGVVRDAYNETVDHLIREISGSDRIEPPPAPTENMPEAIEAHKQAIAAYREQVKRFTEETKKALAEKVEVELRPIKSSGLRLDDNPVPAAALAVLLPLITWEEPEGSLKNVTPIERVRRQRERRQGESDG